MVTNFFRTGRSPGAPTFHPSCKKAFAIKELKEDGRDTCQEDASQRQFTIRNRRMGAADAECI